ncbi:MAG: hypothetical protein ACTHPD_00940 [Rhizomicrobium sp.]
MTGAVTWEVLSWFVGIMAFVIMVCCAILWKLYTLLLKFQQDLSDHKLEVAEKYVTKDGMREQTSQIMGAIGEIKRAIDGTNTRIDMILQNPPSARRSRGSSE